MEEEVITKSYPVQQCANTIKLISVHEVLSRYHTLCTQLSNCQLYNFFYKHIYFDRNAKFNVNTLLSARYQQTAQYQVVKQLKSYISNLKNEFIRIVYRSQLTETQQLELLYINKSKGWYHSQLKRPVNPDNFKLARYIMRHLFHKHNKPSFSNCNMELDNKVAKIIPNNGNSTFDYWITLSTSIKNKTVQIPIKSNYYFETAPGTHNKFAQFNFKNNNFNIIFSKQYETDHTKYIPKTDKIAIDIGMRELLATNKGDLFGRNIIDTLRLYDKILIQIVKQRDKECLSIRTRRYNEIVQYIKDILKQTVCRSINRIIDIHAPAEIIIEKLNFQCSDLSKWMNRLLHNCGIRAINDKLEQINKEYGIKITKVPAPYSSQSCDLCWYVDENNRTNRNQFKCKFCNHSLHADVIGARNHFTE